MSQKSMSEPFAVSNARFLTHHSSLITHHSSLPLDHRAIGDDAVLGDDDDAVADEVAVAVIVLMARFVEDLHAGADARVLINDGTAYVAVRADAHSRVAAIDVGLHLLNRLIEVRAHHQHAFEPRAVLDAAAYADHRIGHGRAV